MLYTIALILKRIAINVVELYILTYHGALLQMSAAWSTFENQGIKMSPVIVFYDVLSDFLNKISKGMCQSMLFKKTYGQMQKCRYQSKKYVNMKICRVATIIEKDFLMYKKVVSISGWEWGHIIF